MEDNRKSNFRLNLQDILGEANSEASLSHSDVTETELKTNYTNQEQRGTIHDDASVLLDWLSENCERPDFNSLTALLIIDKHLRNPDLPDEVREKLIGYKEKLQGESSPQEVSARSRTWLGGRYKLFFTTLVVSICFGFLFYYYYNDPIPEFSLGAPRVNLDKTAQTQSAEKAFEKVQIDTVKIFLEQDNSGSGGAGLPSTKPNATDNVAATGNEQDTQSAQKAEAVLKNDESKGAQSKIDPPEKSHQSIKYPFEAEVVVSTPVLSSPSLDGVEVGFLEAGAIALVVGESGSFYRISARDGRDGFILKQDVSEKKGIKKQERNPNEPVSPFSYEAVDPNRRD